MKVYLVMYDSDFEDALVPIALFKEEVSAVSFINGLGAPALYSIQVMNLQ